MRAAWNDRSDSVEEIAASVPQGSSPVAGDIRTKVQAELVGGVAVVGSLIFVGLQVRLSNKLAQAESTRTWVHAYNTQIFAPLGEAARGRAVASA